MHSDIQESAVRALGDLGDERAVEPLIGLLSHEDSDIQYYAVQALGDLGDERAVEPLIGLLSHEDSDIQQYCYAMHLSTWEMSERLSR